MIPVLKHPFSAIVCGSSNSGKSVLVRNIIKQTHNLVYNLPCNQFKQIILVYKVFQPMYNNLSNEWGGIPIRMYKDALPAEDSVDDFLTQIDCVDSVIVFDDGVSVNCMEQVYDIFTKCSHHLNVSVFYLCHVLFDAKNPMLRHIQRNCQYLFYFKNPRDNRSLQTLSYQMFPEKDKAIMFIKGIQEETKEPHSYVMIDFAQDTPDSLRLKSDILCQHSSYITVRSFPETKKRV